MWADYAMANVTRRKGKLEGHYARKYLGKMFDAWRQVSERMFENAAVFRMQQSIRKQELMHNPVYVEQQYVRMCQPVIRGWLQLYR